MTSLGKCLVFHFKYQQEMEHLYWQNQEADNDDGVSPEVGGVQVESPYDAETLKMVSLVGEQCNREATVFLQQCGQLIENHFEAVGQSLLYRLPSQIWRISYGVWPKQAHKPHLKSKWKMRAGVEIPRPGSEIIVWLWGIGKSDGARAIAGQLNGATVAPDNDDLSPGHVVLDRISVQNVDDNGHEVACDQMLNRVKEAFGQVNAEKLDTIYQLL